MKSDIARLRRQIELECTALRQALNGFAVSASHEAITARYDRLGAYQEELEQLTSPQKANEAVCEIYTRCLG